MSNVCILYREHGANGVDMGAIHREHTCEEEQEYSRRGEHDRGVEMTTEE